MGVASVGLVYDLTRRRFGRAGGFVAGAVLALTPIAVAVSRHNNPDALLVLCVVGALWAVVRGLEDGRVRWLVLAGVCVGLGFETKMGAALLVVPGARRRRGLWAAPRARVRGLLAGGAAMVVGRRCLAAAVALTPASRAPLDLGHVGQQHLVADHRTTTASAGSTARPAGPGGLAAVRAAGGGGAFGGDRRAAAAARTRRSAGRRAGCSASPWSPGSRWSSRRACRRRDPATGWLLAVGGSALTAAVAF